MIQVMWKTVQQVLQDQTLEFLRTSDVQIGHSYKPCRMSSCVRVAMSSACDFEYARCLCAGCLPAALAERGALGTGWSGVNAGASADRFGDELLFDGAVPFVSCPPNVLPPIDAPYTALIGAFLGGRPPLAPPRPPPRTLPLPPRAPSAFLIGTGLLRASPLVGGPCAGGKTSGLPVSAEIGVTPCAGSAATTLLSIGAPPLAGPPRFLFLGLLGLDLPPLLPPSGASGLESVSAMMFCCRT